MRVHVVRLNSSTLPKGTVVSLLLLALVLALAASSASVAHAATIRTVNVCADSGAGTLREAITSANGSSGDTINFSLSSPCTILLGSGLPQILHDMTINGPGESNLILDGQGSNQVLLVYCTTPHCVVNISGLTIQNGLANYGAGIAINQDDVTLSHITVKNNTTNGNGAAVNCGGGCIATLNDVTISNNSATSAAAAAAGLYGDSGSTLFLNDVTFDSNTSSATSSTGGAFTIYHAATLNHATFTNNTTVGNGGAIYSSGIMTVTNSLFANNSAATPETPALDHYGGAIYFGSTLPLGSIDSSTFISNTATDGGGMNIATTGSLTVTNTSFISNTATTTGGGIFNNGNIKFANVTFSGNKANDGYGGAVDNNADSQVMLTNATMDHNYSKFPGSAIANSTGSTTTVVNSTIAENSGTQAIAGYSGITLKNTIVSNNAVGNCSLYSGVVTDGGGNLNWAASGSNCPGISADPKLAALANNGGLVQTRALLAGSGAVNAGNATVCAAAVGSPTYGAGGVDARGLARRSGYCDIGAFEAQPASVSTTGGSSPQSAQINAAFAMPLEANVSDANTNGLGGVAVSFAAPASGASAVLSGTTASSNASGNVSVTATANSLAGSYSVTASATGAAPATFNLTNTGWPTTTTITSHLPHPSRAGEGVTVGFTVTSTYGTPTGNVTVSDGSVNCTGTVAAGHCTITFPTGGTKTLTASYAGEGSFGGSPSGSVTHAVNWGLYLPLMKRP